MNREDIYNGISGIDAKMVEEAETHRFHRPIRVKRLLLLAAVLIISISMIPALGGGCGAGRSAGNDSDEFNFSCYEGPTFTLTSTGHPQCIHAERNLDYDFSPYFTTYLEYPPATGKKPDARWDRAAIITDTYTITSTAVETEKIAFVYPFEYRKDSELPGILVNGCAVKPEVHICPSAEETAEEYLMTFGTWEDYRNLYWNDDVNISETLAVETIMGQPVTVYSFKDFSPPDDKDSLMNIYLDCYFDPTKTTFTVSDYTYPLEVIGEPSSGHLCVMLHGYYDETWFKNYPLYLYVLGQPLERWELHIGGSDPAEPLSDCEAEVKVTKATLHDAFFGNQAVSGINLEEDRGKELDFALRLPYSEPFNADIWWERIGKNYEFPAALLKSEDDIPRFPVFYEVFEVPVPPDDTITIEIKDVKAASTDYPYLKRAHAHVTDGYDLCPGLGCHFDISSQTVSVSNMDNIEIRNNNIGFDLKKGITSVALDPEEEHYWMRISHVKTR